MSLCRECHTRETVPGRCARYCRACLAGRTPPGWVDE